MSPAELAQKTHLSVSELALHWGCHKESVRRALRKGFIKATWLLGHWRIPREEVERIGREGMGYVWTHRPSGRPVRQFANTRPLPHPSRPPALKP